MNVFFCQQRCINFKQKMITILITEDELKVKEALAAMLEKEGYALSAKTNQDDVIRVVKKDCIRDLAFIKDRS